MPPKIGLITFGDPRPEVHEARRTMMEQEVEGLGRAVSDRLDLVRTEPVRTKTDLLAVLGILREAGAEGVILHTPIFTSPNLVVLAARLLSVPVIVIGNTRAETHSTVAYLASTGGLEQAGLDFDSILVDTAADALGDRVLAFGCAAAAKARLEGCTFGVFGGRSLGIMTGTADAAQWLRVFGVDVQHIDQSEIIRRAQEVPAESLSLHHEWLTANVGRIAYGGLFTASSLERQMRSYLATRAIARDMQLDFLGVKCQTELSDHYAVQCLNCTLHNDPYDAEGEKEPTPCSCEADHDGALTMQILKVISGGQPTALLDVRHIPESGPVVLANCGSLPTWFAARSCDVAENLAQVHLVPHVFGLAGGCAVQFVAGEGPVTLARLTRSAERYRMLVVRGTARHQAREVLSRTTPAFPHVFVEGDFARPALIRELRANHVHMTAGDHAAALCQFCRMLKIACTVLG